jgi:flagellar hook assembly protein FlgD
VATAVDDYLSSDLPTNFSLSQNYPNPFNPSTTIDVALPRRAHITLIVYNILGQQVTTLLDETLPAGPHSVTWDGLDATGRQVASGLYLYRLVADDFSETKKMVFLK